MMASAPTVYSKVVKISRNYLGPAGERFIRRQISTHLEIEPEELTKKDIPQLVNWAGLAFAILTNDQAEVDGFTSELLAVSKSK